MKQIFLLIFLMFTSAAISQSKNRGAEVENVSEKKGKTHVIIVGISNYKNLPDAQQLNFADDDAILLQEYFKTWGDINFKIFLNDNATNKDKIGREIQMTLLNESQPGDEVIIYFAGHGDVDTLMNDGFLLLNGVEAPEVSSYSFNDAISLSLIQRYVNVAADKRMIQVMFIADACHSGAVTNANEMISKINSNVSTITSCQQKEVSQESIEFGNGHGVFTYYLVQGLMGLADMDGDKKIDLMELEMYVKLNVSKRTLKAQNPVFMGSSQREIALVNDELLKIATKGENLNFQNLSAFTKTKSVSNPVGEVNGPCKAMLHLLQEQTIENNFFPDELDSLEKLPYVIGSAQAKKSHSKSVHAIALSVDGKFTASASVDGIAVSQGMDLKQLRWFKGHSAEVTAIDFSPAGVRLVSGALDKTVIIWNVATGEKIQTLDKISSEVSSIRFISESQILIGTLKGSIILWEPEINVSKEYKQHKGKITDIEMVYPIVITAGEDGQIHTFNLTSRKKEGSFEGASGMTVNSLKVLYGSQQLLSAGEDGKLLKWDLNNKKLLTQVTLDMGPIKDIDADPFERYCFIASKQKKASVIDLLSDKAAPGKLSTISGANSLVYDPIYHQLKIAEVDGSISSQEVKVKPTLAAIEVHEQLQNCEELKSLKYKMDGTLIIGLNNQVNKVLNELVNGGTNQPSTTDISNAKRYAEKALEVGKEYDVDADKLEINLRLLEIYEILLDENHSQYSLAIEKVKRIEALDPNGAYVYNIAAELYAKLGESKKAMEMSEKAETLAPKWSQASVNTGKVLLINRDKSGAEKKFKEAITETPNESKGYAALGELYLSQGKLEDAKRNLERAIQIDSGAVAIKAYQETMSQIETLNSRGGNGVVGPIPLNAAFYRGYTNVLKLSASDYKTFKLVASGASLSKQGDSWALVTHNVAKSVVISIISSTTGKTLGIYEIPVKNVPQAAFWWGTATEGERVDLTADKFIYGYNPKIDPDLDNEFFEIVNYVVQFQGGGLSFSGTGSSILEQVNIEVIRCRKAGLKSGVCVSAVVKNKHADVFTVEPCFQF